MTEITYRTNERNDDHYVLTSIKFFPLSGVRKQKQKTPFSGADEGYAVLCCVVLCCAMLCCAMLCCNVM